MKIFNGIYKLAGKLRSIMIDTDGNGDADCEVLRVGQYAIYSKPLKDSRVFCINQGNKNYSIAEYKPEIQDIEKLLKDGDIAIDTGSVRMHFKHSSGELEISGVKAVSIGGETALSLINENFINWADTHTHPAPGGATSVPTQLLSSMKETVTTKILKGA